MGAVGVGADGARAHAVPEAGPTSAGFEFGGTAKQLGVTADAVVRPAGFVVPVGTAEGPLGAALAGNAKLLRRELLAPLLLAGAARQAAVQAAGRGVGGDRGAGWVGHGREQNTGVNLRNPGPGAGAPEPAPPGWPPPPAGPSNHANQPASRRGAQGRQANRRPRPQSTRA